MTERPGHDPRVFLAAERTLLAWIRTGLAMLGLGFVVARFDVLASGATSRLVGTSLILLAVAFTTVSAAAYLNTVRRLRTGEPFEGRPSVIALALASLLVLLGSMTAIYLLST